jgi:hypothetical protein
VARELCTHMGLVSFELSCELNKASSTCTHNSPYNSDGHGTPVLWTLEFTEPPEYDLSRGHLLR